VSTQSLSERMAAAARDMQGQHERQPTLDSAARLAVDNVPGADAASISIVHRQKRIETDAFTDEMARLGDQLQYQTGQGPCLDSIWKERTTYSPSLGYDRRWPKWGPRVVAETGAESVLAFQLFTTEHTLGALNLYSRTRDGFDDADKEEGLALAAHIAIAVAAATELAQLSRVVDTRTVIGQATGVLMERYDVDPAHAFALLIRLSSTDNVKIRDLSVEIIGGHQVPQHDAG
jgi:transcriptional regulator with GAF, ATPase, and Fis domain